MKEINILKAPRPAKLLGVRARIKERVSVMLSVGSMVMHKIPKFPDSEGRESRRTKASRAVEIRAIVLTGIGSRLIVPLRLDPFRPLRLDQLGLLRLGPLKLWSLRLRSLRLGSLRLSPLRLRQLA